MQINKRTAIRKSRKSRKIRRFTKRRIVKGGRDNIQTIKNDNELKTIGDLANRNRDRMTDDHKTSLEEKHNSYKESESTKELPKGMSRIQKPKTKYTWPT